MKPTIIIRHKKENLKKCSLSGLEKRSDFLFLTYPYTALPDLSSYVVLKLGAPQLTSADSNKGLLLIDSTWRYSETILKQLEKVPNLEYRGLPPVKTAYPRRQTACACPDEGLASIEALFVAFSITERENSFLLDNYHWKELFLQNLAGVYSIGDGRLCKMPSPML